MNRAKLPNLLLAVAAVLSLGLCVVLADAFNERIVNVGDKAPRFTVTTDRGRQLTPADFGGKVLVLNFWATWCSPCVEEMPSLQALAARLASKGVVVLGVSVDRNPAAYQRFIEQARVKFETARDPDAIISAGYGTFKYPETYVIDSQGRVRQKHIGPRDWMDAELIQSIESLL